MGKSGDRRSVAAGLTALVYLIAVVGAFAIGSTGLPGRAVAAMVGWLAPPIEAPLR